MTPLRASLSRAARQTRRLHTSPALSAAESSSSKPSQTLLPSVQHLLHEHGLSTEDAQKMTPTGPSGRLLKGDVLAYIGSISKSYPSDLSKRLSTLSHLDLSNIKMAAPKTAPAPTAPVVPAPEDEPPVLSEIALPISLAAVVGVQKKIHQALGVQLPISTFLARATELANEDLPRSSSSRAKGPTADELFDAVLGLDKVNKRTTTTTARGHFYPQIAAVPARAPARTAQADVLDLLAGTGTGSRGKGPAAVVGGESVAPEGSVFSVSVAEGEETRGRVFLERIKTILEVEPGRLVL